MSLFITFKCSFGSSDDSFNFRWCSIFIVVILIFVFQCSTERYCWFARVKPLVLPECSELLMRTIRGVAYHIHFLHYHLLNGLAMVCTLG